MCLSCFGGDDLNLEGCLDLADELDGCSVITDSSDRSVKLDIASINLDRMLCLQGRDNVSGGDSSEELSTFARTCVNRDRQRADSLGEGHRLGMPSIIFLLALDFQGVNALELRGGCLDDHRVKELEVAGLHIRDFLDFPDASEVIDIFEQNDLHN